MFVSFSLPSKISFMKKLLPILLFLLALFSSTAQEMKAKRYQRFAYEQMSGEYCMDITGDTYHGVWHHILTLNSDRTFTIYDSGLGMLGESRRTGEYTIVGNQLRLDFKNENQYVKPSYDRDFTVLHFYDKWSKDSLPVLIRVFPEQRENDTVEVVLSGIDTIKGEFDSILCVSLAEHFVIPSKYAGYDITIFLFNHRGDPENPISCTKPIWRIRSKNKIIDPYYPFRYRVFRRKIETD